MTVTAPNPATSPATGQAPGPATGQTADQPAGAGSDSAVLSSDYNTFLVMLTTQMQNQDPLNPIDSTDFAVQLATFSGVEQQVRTNELLEGLSGQMGFLGMSQLAGWVGMEARAATPVHFDGAPLTLMPEPPATADEAELVVYDASGTEVQRVAVPVTEDPITWAGVDNDGNPLPEGTYTFRLESYGYDELLTSEVIEVYAPVAEARNEGGSVILVLDGGIEVPAEQVTALRAPGAG